MILTTLIILSVIFTLYYVLFFVLVQSGLRSLNILKHSYQQLPYVSVIVSARNEELNIESCVRNILNQDYPQNLWEILIVDDCSTDRTMTILRQMADKQMELRALSTGGKDEVAPVGKPAAISIGVKAARGEVILTTDADCIVPRTWISTMVGHMGPSVAFIAGPVEEMPNATILSKFSHLEYLGLMTTAAGLIGAHRPILCSGANLGYRKQTFLEAQGYGKNGTWCDDETLMHRIREQRLGEIVFVPSIKALVKTESVNSFASFWRQRLRWSAKGNNYESLPILLSVIGLYVFFLFLLVAFIGSFFDSQLLALFLIPFVLKLAIDYSTLSKGARLFCDRVSSVTFLFAEIFHVPYVVFAAGLGQFVSFEWKGRTIRL